MERNAGLETIKGIGRAAVKRGGRMQTARVVWAISGYEKIRIEVLDAAGKPAVRFADNGDTMTLVTSNPLKFYKKPSSSGSLAGLLDAPVRAADMIALLTGRIPARSHRSMRMVPSESDSGADYVLELKRFWGSVAAKIHFDESSGDVSQVEMFDSAGDLAYRAVLHRIRRVEGYRLPMALQIFSGEGEFFRLDIRRCWPDVPIDPALFVLTPPDSDGQGKQEDDGIGG